MQGDPHTVGQEWRSNWGMVLAGTLGMALLTIPSVTLGQFMEPLQREFGWSRTEISFGLTIFAVITTPLAPFAGALADRFGSRKVAVPGAFLNGLALAAFGLVTGYYWHFLAAWSFYSFTQLLIRTTVWNRAASASFVKSLGLALAVMMAGIPLAQTLAPIAAEWLIGDFGWRTAYLGLGLGWGGVTFVVAMLIFREAGDKQRPIEIAGTSAAPAASGLSLAEALRDVRIWRLCLAILLQATMITGIMVHIFPLLTEAGLSRDAATGIVALLGVSSLGGQFATGVLADRVSSTILPVSCFLLPMFAFALLLQGKGSPPLLALSVVFAGFSASACVTVTTYLTSRYAGTLHFGKIYGVISSCMGLGAGLGPLLAGGIFDLTGNYDAFLMAGIAGAIVNGLLVLRLGGYPVFPAASKE